ncbi:MAG: hydroxyethylthiazole kinase [Dermatophilaceae bacterium]
MTDQRTPDGWVSGRPRHPDQPRHPDRLRGEIRLAVVTLRERAPLVHGICGTVTQGMVADGLLAAGARPMLTATREEAPALVAVADALLVNLGSLSSDARSAAVPTVRAAQRHSVPWVLDPVAVGVAPVRTPLARELLAHRPDAVRGNASEVLTLANGSAAPTESRGTDSTVDPDRAAQAARHTALEYRCVVAVSGPVDLVADGDGMVRVANGIPLLARVSGTGCLLGALTAAMLAGARLAGTTPGDVTPLGAVVAATAMLTVAAEHAVGLGPGTFRAGLLDSLASVSPDQVADEAALRWG